MADPTGPSMNLGEQAAVPVVVFDLDATLVAGDSMASYLRTHLPRRPAALMLALALAPLWAPALVPKATRRAGQQLLLWLCARGLSADELRASVRDFAADYVGARGRSYPSGVEAVVHHVHGGQRVIIATECWDLLARALCEASGLPVAGQDDTGAQGSAHQRAVHKVGRPHLQVVHVVGEDLGVGGWRHLRLAAHYKDGKVAALQRAGVTFPVSAAYSDSTADLPLLMRAQMPHVVNPSRRQRRRFRRALGSYIRHDWIEGDVRQLRLPLPVGRPAPGAGAMP